MSPEREPNVEGRYLAPASEGPNTGRVRWVRVLALVACLSAVAVTAAATPPATLATFTDYGWGHDRGMGINQWGRGYAQINSGAGCPCFGVAFQLSRVKGTA